MKRALSVTAGALGLLLVLAAFAPKNDDPIDRLLAALQQWTINSPQEKVYLHLDKPYYGVGDTIWFKGYVMAGTRHQLSALSGAVYVDLVTEKDSILRSLKLPVTAGMIMGDLVLNDEFTEGSYRIRAHTRWMRNAGEDYFFDRTITVGAVSNTGVNGKVNYTYQTTDNKTQLLATLNYTDDSGKPMADRSVEYQIMINRKVVYTKNIRTDANGNVAVNIANSDKADLRGAYIKTIIRNNANDKISKDFPIKANLVQSDVQFFPEGGNLVEGLASRVGFKAVGIDGAGIAIKGNITDSENKEVALIETLHAGMGSFNLRPEAGKNYKANITFADGSTKTMDLPKAQADGFVLSVYQPNKDSVLVRVAATAGAMQSQPTVSLVGQTNGEAFTGSSFKIDKALTSVWLAKKDLQSGIAQFTLFGSNNEPLNERLAFIKSKDQLQLTVKTAKANYKSKEQIHIFMKAKDSKDQPTFGNYSVSVINESKVPVDEASEHTIFSDVLLSSELRGYVEKPNFYFTEAPGVDKALDNLMLTQGYRRFTWKQITAPAVKPAFEVEGLGTTISGVVNTLGSKPMPGASVVLMSVKANVMLQTQSDSLGRFKFDKIFATDSISFAVQARTPKNTDKAIVILDSVPKVLLAKNRNIADVSTDISYTLKAFLDAGKAQDDIYEKFGMLDKVQRLREVRINAKRNATPSTVDMAPQGMFRINSASADRTMVVRPEEAERFQTLANYLQAVLPQVRVQTGALAKVSTLRGAPMQIILNGRALKDDEGSEVLDGSVQPEDVVKVDVVSNNLPIMSLLGGPSLLIYTKNTYMRKIYTPNVVNIKPKGFNKVREFYLPKYNKPGNDQLPDLRSTIYWNPYVKTDVAGQALLSYYNADGPGTYKVVIEGVNSDGELGRAVYRYTVDGSPLIAAAVNDNKDATIKAISASLDTMRTRFPIEKVYLHTDRPYYSIGDTLWFKSYVVNGTNFTPSNISKLLYVEIANDTAHVVRRLSVEVKNGVAWGQIPLTRNIFNEGGITLRAYTNWMRNFGEDHVFKQRFYLGVPTTEAWLVKSTADIKQVNDKDQLDIDLKITRADKSPVSLRKVEAYIFEDTHRKYYAENKHYIYKEQLTTGIDGSLKFSNALKNKADGRRMRVELRSLEGPDRGKVVQVPLNINRLQKLDVQFLPEGGQLVAGLTSTIAFKAIGEDGKGASVMGEICDSKGVKVADFASTYNGMGSFVLTPKPGETYSVKIIQPTIKTFDLPKVNQEGTVMHIINNEDTDSLTVSLKGAGGALLIDSAYYLVGTSRGRVYHSEKVDLNQAEVVVSKARFPTGIARFTLFRGKRPLNERMVFIDRKDKLSVTLIPSKPTHLKRDSIGLGILVTDKTGMPVKGSFSLAVTDDSQVRADSLGNNSIAANLLINSDLKGYIETPGYYVQRKTKEAWADLDNLLLTQGWTAYDWKDAFAGSSGNPYFAADKAFKITGTVTNLSNKPIPNSEVVLSSQKPNFLTTAITDDQGHFIFNKLPVIDTGSFFFQASNAKGKTLSFGAITIDKPTYPKVPLTLGTEAMPWYVNADSVQLNYVKRKAELDNDANFKAKGNMLREVAIKSKKVIPGSFNPFGPGNSDLAFDQKEIKAASVTNLWDLLVQKLPGVRIRDVSFRNWKGRDMFLPVLDFGAFKRVFPGDLIIDGAPVELDVSAMPTISEVEDALKQIPVISFKGLEIIYSSEYTNRQILSPASNQLEQLRYKSVNFDGAMIVITTVTGTGWFQNSAKPGTATYRPLPVTRPVQFYSPKYDVKAGTAGMPDYRATIYWEPNINTDANGKAKAAFYSNDVKSGYTIKIAGIDESGSIGDGSIKIKAQ